MHQFHKRVLCFFFTAVALTGCATNGFKNEYRGKLYTPTKSATVVSSVPAGATLIGHSNFFVSNNHSGNCHAITAAKAVGADFVTWQSDHRDSRSYHSGSVYDSDDYYEDSKSVPYSYTIHTYGYSSSFYRSSDLMKDESGEAVRPIGKTRTKNIYSPRVIEWEYFENK